MGDDIDTSIRVPVGSRQQQLRLRQNSVSSSGSLDSVTRRYATVTPKVQQSLEQKMLRWFVSAGNAFNQADNEFFLDFMGNIIPKFLVPDQLLVLCTAQALLLGQACHGTAMHLDFICCCCLQYFCT